MLLSLQKITKDNKARQLRNKDVSVSYVIGLLEGSFVIKLIFTLF